MSKIFLLEVARGAFLRKFEHWKSTNEKNWLQRTSLSITLNNVVSNFAIPATSNNNFTVPSCTHSAWQGVRALSCHSTLKTIKKVKAGMTTLQEGHHQSHQKGGKGGEWAWQGGVVAAVLEALAHGLRMSFVLELVALEARVKLPAARADHHLQLVAGENWNQVPWIRSQSVQSVQTNISLRC